MADLIPLARLVNWAKTQEICSFDLKTTVERQENINQAEVTRQWQAEIILPATHLPGHQAQTIEGACHNLIQLCHQQGIEIPAISDPETIIPHHQAVAMYMANLYKMLPQFEKKYLSLMLQYVAGTKLPQEPYWNGSIYEDTRWSNYHEVITSTDTLHELCIELWEEGLKKLER